MHRKSLFFGIGFGSLAAVLLIFIVYIIQRSAYFDEISGLEELLDNEPNQIYAELQDEDIILRARELGMIFFYEIDLPQETNTDTAAEETAEAEEAALEHIEGPGEIEIEDIEEIESPEPLGSLEPPEAPGSPSGFRWVHIPEDLAATDIAAILGEAGIITDVGDFVRFLIDNGYTMTIMAGNFLLPIDADYEVIVERILAGM